MKNGEGCYVADEATLDVLEAEGRVVAYYSGATRTARLRDIAGITNERGNVVGIMPHPEHAVEDLTGPGTDGLGFFTSVLKELVQVIDTVKNAEATPDDEMPYAELGLKDDEYAQHPSRSSAAGPRQSELAMYSIMWSEHCSYKSSKVHLRAVRGHPQGRPDARRHGRERRRRRRRRGPRGHLQGRVAQPPDRTSSPTRARPPASAASCATSSRWAPARSW